MTATTRAMPRAIDPGESSRRLGLAVLGVALLVFFSLAFDNFFTVNNLVTTAQNVSSIAIASVGTMALLISGNVDLSIGSQFALISVTVATVVRDTQNALAGVVVALLLGALLGFVNGVLVKLLNISPLIVTLGMLAIYRGLAFVVAEGVSVYGFPYSFTAIAGLRIAEIPLTVLVALAIFLIGAFVLLRTVPGLRLYAIGGNPEAARMVGIRVDRMVIGAFTLSGLLMGVVALLSTSRLASGSPNVGLQFELDVLTAVILGGVLFTGGAGHPIGVIVGVFTIGVLNAGLIFAGFQDWWQQITKGGLLLLALSLDQLIPWWRRRRERQRATAASTAASSGPVERTRLRGSGDFGAPVLEASGISVSYGAVRALDDASLTVRAGEVVCLVGDNGAGKSTLIKAISGVTHFDEGTIRVGGEEMVLRDPSAARRAGIETVYQDLALCQNLGAAHNLILGEEPRRRLLGVVPVRDDRAAIVQTQERLTSLGVAMTDVKRPVRALSGGQRQAIAISRVLRDDVRLVIMDEPTAALGVAQTDQVLRLVRRTADEGRGVILISHDIEDIFAVADRIVVLQLGRVVFDGPIDDLTRLDLIQLMAGMTTASDGPVPGRR
ncbi:MAG: ATP-binding cassette domain-containing protein [Microbacteriaceae bacterium]|nr:ATP-binding cassette domain-containing protein [Microbacteriaceae bacterium]